MKYGSVCSGIEAATVAWHDLGMTPAWFAEIADFPSRVLAARYPSVPNRGDFTRIGHEAQPESVDVLVGGTPCQSFSISGGRAGLDDPRGHLAVEFLLLARRLGARWILWENVPGVLSVDDGDAFATFISLMAEVGYGLCWRVLDAQWCGVPQRRRRVFVVGYLGDWRPSAAVLLERPSMRGNPAKGRGARKATAGQTEGVARALGEGRVTNALTAHADRGDLTVTPLVVDTLRACAGKSTNSVGPLVADVIGPLLGHHHRNAPDDPIVVSDTLRSQGRAPDHGHIAVVPIQDATRSRVRKQNGIGIGRPGDPMFTGMTRGEHAVAFHVTQDPISGQVSPALATEPGCIGVLSFDETQITSNENRSRPLPGAPAPAPALASGSGGRVMATSMSMRPRRLTPREWERLQGFPDDYTLIDGAEDSPRYEALGNSMAVPVMRWIGKRLVAVERLVRMVQR